MLETAKPIFGSISLLFVLTLFNYGQGLFGSIEGTVSDPNGAAVSGASAAIKSSAGTNGFERRVVSDQKGYFIISNLPPGKYTISIEHSNFERFSKDVDIVVDQTFGLNAFLSISGGTDPIVDDLPEAIDRRASSSDASFSGSAVSNLPRATTFSSILKYAPNVRPEAIAGGFQIDGGSGAENTFFIDGQEVTNYRLGILNTNDNLPFELIREIQVKSTGFNAEYQGATGGVVNVVTLGGSDDWHGNLGISLSPDKINGSPNSVLNRFGTTPGSFEYFQPNKDDGTAYFPVATVSGPLVKNRLWFSAVYAPQIFDQTRKIDYYTSPNPATRTISESIKYDANLKSEFAFVRFDAQPYSNFTLFGTFLWNPIVQDGAVPSNSEGLSGSPQQINSLRGSDFLSARGGRQNGNTVNGQASWAATRELLINIRAGRTFLNEKLNSYGIPDETRYLCSSNGSPELVPGSNCTRGFQNFSSNYKINADTSIRTTFDADAAFAGVNLGGRHIFKGGYRYNHLFSKKDEGYADNGYAVLFYNVPISSILGLPPTPGNLGSGLIQRFGEIGDAENTNHALFIQDSWQIRRRLTLNLGLRFENEDVPSYDGEYDIKFGWNDKISPRFGAAFDLTGDGRTKLFGSYGWFYDRLKYDMPRSLGAEVFSREYFEILPSRGAAYTNYTFERIIGSATNLFHTECPLQTPSGWSICRIGLEPYTNIPVIVPTPPRIDPGLKPSRLSEFTVGIEREMAKGILIAGRYSHKQLDRVIEDVGTFNPQGSESYSITNPGYGVICRDFSDPSFPSCTKAERKYDAVEIRIDRRSNNYFFDANYTWSRLFGNYSGLASSDESGLVAPNVTRYFDRPSMGYNADGIPDNGLLATDRPHVFKAFGGYSFNWFGASGNRTTVSAFTTVQSGTPKTTVFSLYNIASSILFERGDLGRTEAFSQTDLAINHLFGFGQDNRFTFEPFIQIINLFGERNELAAQNSISSTNFTSTALTQGGCTTCQYEAIVYDTIFNQGGLGQYILNYLNNQGVSSAGTRNDYGLPVLFQSPRNMRFGFRFTF